MDLLTLGWLCRIFCSVSVFDPETIIACLPSGNTTLILKTPPSQIVFALPGMLQVQFLRSIPEGLRSGFATKPKGWSFRHCLLDKYQPRLEVRNAYRTYRSSSNLFMQSVPMFVICASDYAGLRYEQMWLWC